MGLSQKALFAAVERSQKQATKKGCEPGAATCRGKLQHRRSRLNVDINKHLLLRQGAENLLRAAENKKVRQAVSLELNFLNSNLQHLKEELSDLNSSVDIYQLDSQTQHIPMIPFGLKETKPIHFEDAFKQFIVEHYKEDAEPYSAAIQEFSDSRQAIRTPQRSNAGLALLFEYYNQLYFIERRFFPPDRSLGVYFEWYDSFTGLPSCQRTVAFEKASVLFNMAALHSQLGAREDRDSRQGLDATIEHYLRAAGIYRYILENFSNAPSRDLDPDILEVFSSLLTAQAGECRLERLLLDERQADLTARISTGREAAQVSEVYQRLRKQMTPAVESEEEPLPPSWQQLAHIKEVHYCAVAHSQLALGLLDRRSALSDGEVSALHQSQRHEDTILGAERASPRTASQAHYLGRCHLREAVSQHEEALRLYRMSRGLRKQETLLHVLRVALELVSERQQTAQQQDDFDVPVQPPTISGGSVRPLTPRPPEFGRHRVTDLFGRLGPLEAFSAHHHWSPPRQVTVSRHSGQPLGFSLKREAPVVVVDVEPDGAAERAGLRDGDYIVAMAGRDLKWGCHADVVELLRDAGDQFSLTVVTPHHGVTAHTTEEEPPPPDGTWSSSSSRSGVTSETGSTTVTTRRHSWNPFRRATRTVT